MSREIKFRAWDKKTKEYFHISELWNSGTNPECFNFDGWTDNFGNKGRLKDIAIEQYTGLKDVNSNEIYEGDIVKYTAEDGDSFLAPVKYFAAVDYPAFDIPTAFIPYYWYFESNVLSAGMAENSIEVVGNIHDNLELLEESNE